MRHPKFQVFLRGREAHAAGAFRKAEAFGTRGKKTFRQPEGAVIRDKEPPAPHQNPEAHRDGPSELLQRAQKQLRVISWK